MPADAGDSSTGSGSAGSCEPVVDIESVRDGICSAFSGVRLGGGVGLREAQGLDAYEDEASRAVRRRDDEKDDWRIIRPADLNRCNSSLSFFDAEGMRFHLPAFLVADLDGVYEFGMAFHLTHLDSHGIGQFSLLSPEQRAAVRRYLQYISTEDDYAFERPAILRALVEFWT